MSDNLPAIAAETAAKAAVAVLVPYGGVANLAWDGIRKGVAARTEKTITEILADVEPSYFAERCAESPEFEAVVLNALDGAARTGYEAKRRLFGRVVRNAALDDARVDEATLFVQALRELEGPHIRALERIRMAEDTYVVTAEDEADINKYRPESRESQRQMKRSGAAVTASFRENEAVRATLHRVGVIALSNAYMGPQTGGSVTEFGRRLLDELLRP